LNAELLRLMVVSDRRLAEPRTVLEVVEAALAAGTPAIQLRDKEASAAELFSQARALLPAVRIAGALLFINDRVDVALAVGADGVHIGPSDIPVAVVRRIVPPHFLIGYSTDDPARARAAEADGASYIGCGAVFGTATKEVGDEAIGVDRLDEVAAAVQIPVIGIGGIRPGNVARVAATRAAGAAVVGAVMSAADVSRAVRALLGAWAQEDGGG
jgi:thiamine-phosphate pyrophosphorylase